MSSGSTLVRRSGPHRVEVERHQFLLFTPGGDDDYVPDVIDPREWVRFGSGWIHFLTGAPAAPAEVTVEAWTGIPDRVEGPWDGVRELTMDLQEPAVLLWALTGGPQSELVLVGEDSGTYGVRLACKNRSDGKPAAAHHAETWLIQFWPVP